MSVVIDPQATGWVDDGTESGVVRTQQYGDLVRLPLRPGQFGTSGGIFFGETAGIAGGGVAGEVTLSPTVGLPGSFAYYIRFAFRGTCLGVLFDPYAAASGFYRDFNVTVDGVPYLIKKPYPLFWDGTALAYDSGESAAIVTGLPDGQHVGEIMVCHDSASQNKNIFYGLLVEQRAGYEPMTRLGYFTTPAVVPGTSTAISYVANGLGSAPRGIRQVIYANTTVAAVTITVQLNGTTIWSASLAANATVTWDLGSPVCADASTSSLLKHQASATGSVNFTVVGVN